MVSMYTYRFRLEPNEQQKEMFAKTFGCVRFIYNAMLDDKIKHYQEHHVLLNNTPAQYKGQFPFLREVDSRALTNAQINLKSAFANFSNNPNKFGFPSFKKKHSRQSYSTNIQNVNYRIENHHLKLPKIGLVRIKDHRNIDGICKKVTIVKEPNGEYYANILTERDIRPMPSVDGIIGIDLGITDLITLSDGTVYENPKVMKRYSKKLAREQRKLSRKQKDSRNREKQRIKVARCHSRISNIRKDYSHKITHSIVRENQIIAVEDLDVKSMMQKGNKTMSRNIADASWYELIRQLEYKAKWYGRTFVKIGRYCPSSKLCNVCGYRNKKMSDLSIRLWTCPECGTFHHRDVNAAKNILTKGLQKLGENKKKTRAGAARSHAYGE